jgi:hypothetical protein
MSSEEDGSPTAEVVIDRVRKPATNESESRLAKSNTGSLYFTSEKNLRSAYIGCRVDESDQEGITV